MSSQNLNRVILLLLIAGTFLSVFIVADEIINGNVCPKLGTLPACYIVVIYFVILLLIHFFTNNIIVFLSFNGFALTLSGFTSFQFIFGNTTCSIFYLGIPVCIIVFCIFTLVISLKFFQLHQDSR